jgi:hypothetical protein
MIRLHSVRYGVPVESEHETVEEAVRSAFWEVEHNSASPGRPTSRVRSSWTRRRLTWRLSRSPCRTGGTDRWNTRWPS